MTPLDDSGDPADRKTIDLVVSALSAPERGPDYGRQVWQRLQPKLAGSRAARPPLQPFALAAAVLVLVAAAFLLGRASTKPPEAALSAEARHRVLLVAVSDHLERSRMVLLEFVNASPQASSGARERAWAEELVASNRLYRQSAVRSGEPGMADVLDQLERVLLEIANSPDAPAPEAREALRRRIESEGVLFKIEIIGARAGEGARRPAPRPAAVRS